MNAWLLVTVIVCSTTVADLLQSIEMRRHSALSHPLGLLKRPLLIGSILAMAVSFFSFMALLSVADLSFAVPATAGSLVLETLLARYVLKENVCQRRWAGAMLVASGVALLAM